MKKRVSLVLAAMMVLGVLAGCGSEKVASSEVPAGTESSAVTSEAAAPESSEEPNDEKSEPLDVPVDPVIEIVVADYGTITLQLDSEAAPITVANFVKLVEEGFYDGLTFHRIMSDFMIQGGDPLGTGMGGSDEKIKGEFAQNGVDNPLSHTRGTISMARSNAGLDTASSQFFIVHEDSTFLDGGYAAFGHVTDGMEVVDAICDTVEQGENGAVAQGDQPVIESIRIVE